jgi:hypothetical protein
MIGYASPASAQTEVSERLELPLRGAWLAPREGSPLNSDRGSTVLASMRALGVTHVAIGHEVNMPKMSEPRLEWGIDDEELLGVLARIKEQDMQVFLLPRIESPDFFAPPYPFRADIKFETDAEWRQFHEQMREMLLHYANLAESEGVQLFGIGLELKHSVKDHAEAWREIISQLRQVYSGKLTYSANWYDEWEEVSFWDALDFIGVGAYFELKPENGEPDAGEVEDLVARWQHSIASLQARSLRWDRPVMFTEIGYTGYVDCAERPWEWAGKQGGKVAIDWNRQADCYRALFRAFSAKSWFSGTFIWRFYTDSENIQDWEYALQGRPAERVLGEAYKRR